MRHGIRVLIRGGSLILALLIPAPAWSSYGIYVGKDLTVDGSVLLGGTGDEVSSHWLEIVPQGEHRRGATVRVGVDERAAIPGEFIEIPQVRRTFKYLTMNYSDYMGFPPPLTNGGLNEHQVAARDIWSPSRRELVEMTPTPQRGPNYSDLSRIVMERAQTAREAVEIVGGLIEKHGYSTYGGNSHLFADLNEGWILIEFAGGRGLWVAERLGSDDVRMSYPGYVLEIPPDFESDPDYMGSSNLISFAVERGWYDPESGDPFNANRIYGNGEGRSGTVRVIEERLRRKAPRITLRDMLDTVRDPLVSSDTNGYGQVAHLRRNIRRDLAMLWIAPTGSITAPFIPYWIGVQGVLPEYGKHRYLTKGEATRFVTRDWQPREATRFAYRTFKRLMYYTCDRPEKFLPEVTEALRAFEDRSLGDRVMVESTALELFAAGRIDLARDFLTEYSHRRAMDGLRLGEALLASIEARSRLLFGVREPEGDEMSSLDWERRTTCRSGESGSHESPPVK
jgi:dipeptidase